MIAIRLAKAQEKGQKRREAKPFVRMDNDSRPEKAFITERARRNGRANAASGRIMVSVPNDWFGPILPEHDPENNRVRSLLPWGCMKDCLIRGSALETGGRIEWIAVSMAHIFHMLPALLDKRTEV